MKHWATGKQVNNYVYIYSPTMQLNNKSVFSTFKERKQLRQELFLLENDIRDSGLKGWIGDTKTSYPHIMRLFAKVGARPYMVKTYKDPSKDVIWFMKEV